MFYEKIGRRSYTYIPFASSVINMTKKNFCQADKKAFSIVF